MLAECKHCGTSREIKLKMIDGEYKPVCMECGEVQDGMSKVVVNVMKSNRDIVVDAVDSHSPFGARCEKCGKIQEALFDKKQRAAVCCVCGEKMKVTPYMLRSLELTGHVRPAKESAADFDGGEENTPTK